MGHYAAVKTGELPVSSYEKTTPEGTLPGGVAVAVTASPETVGGRAAHAGVLGMPVGRVEGRLGHGRLGGRAAVPCSRRWYPPRPCSPQQEGHCGRPGNPCAGTGRTAGIATLKRPRGRKGSGYLPGGSARRTVSAPWPALCRTAANLAVVLGDRGPRRTPLWNTWVRVVTRPRATFHVPAWTRPRPQLPGERAVRRTGHRVPY